MEDLTWLNQPKPSKTSEQKMDGLMGNLSSVGQVGLSLSRSIAFRPSLPQPEGKYVQWTNITI